ncbi:MAG: hypothetical protein ACE5KM_02475 [Planctomycetaceae bacterium]
MSTLIVGLVVVGSMESLGVLIEHRRYTSDRNRAELLAEDLMSQVLASDYSDPDGAPVFGPEPLEANGTRRLFDDVDDFHKWDAAPPQERDGTLIKGLKGWRRTVTVEYVDPTDLATTVTSDLGVKRITVTVYGNGRTMAGATTIRTKAGKDVQ